jgi:hypothetical protein
MNRKIIVILALLLLLVLSITLCATAPQRAIRSGHRAVPGGIQFYEENIEFFDLLLDIQQRIINYNEENERQIDNLIFLIGDTTQAFSFSTSIRRESGGGGGGENPDFVLEDEVQLIETTLRLRIPPDRGGAGVSVHVDRIEVRDVFGRLPGTLWMSFISPVEQAEQESRGLQFLTDTAPVNQDWRIFIGTRFLER